MPLKGKRLTTFCASLALLQPLLSLTHWIFRSLMLPYKSSSHSAKCVRSASLRSGGRRLAASTAMEHPIGALPRTPFPASRDFPSRGNEGYEEKTGESYASCTTPAFPPLVAGATSFPPRWEACHLILSRLRFLANPVPLPPPLREGGYYKPVLTIESHMGRLPRGALLSTVHILHRMCKSGEVRRLACP